MVNNRLVMTIAHANLLTPYFLVIDVSHPAAQLLERIHSSNHYIDAFQIMN